MKTKTSIILTAFLAAAGIFAMGVLLNAAQHPKQKAFATPEEAAEALIQATEKYDQQTLMEILGPGSQDLVASQDPVADKNRGGAFVAAAREKHAVAPEPNNPARATLVVGKDDWPLPIPIVKQSGKWFYDSKAGRQEILIRRIGENELNVIQICRGFVEAQHEYSMDKHDGTGVNQFAQKIVSTRGKQDGLAWQTPDGSSAGPVGPAAAKALEQGYTTQGQPYHGYYFKVLKGQGPTAPMGQMDFMVNGVMIGGFALAAAPAQYRVTGVQTFMVSHDGVVYQKDLGSRTLAAFKEMERFNPDQTWREMLEDQ